jgi:hypothetical protein
VRLRCRELIVYSVLREGPHDAAKCRRRASEGGHEVSPRLGASRCEEALGKLLKLRVLGHVLTLTTMRVAASKVPEISVLEYRFETLLNGFVPFGDCGRRELRSSASNCASYLWSGEPRNGARRLVVVTGGRARLARA